MVSECMLELVGRTSAGWGGLQGPANHSDPVAGRKQPVDKERAVGSSASTFRVVTLAAMTFLSLGTLRPQ